MPIKIFSKMFLLFKLKLIKTRFTINRLVENRFAIPYKFKTKMPGKIIVIKDGIIVMSNVVTVSGKLKHKVILFI